MVLSMSTPPHHNLEAIFEGKPDILLPVDVATLLHMSVPTIYRQLKDGILPGFRVGRNWFILRDDLREMFVSSYNK